PGPAANGPSTLSVQPAAGGTPKNIYTNPLRAVTTVRVVTPTTLLLLIENRTGDMKENGLWRIESDGSHLQKLAADPGNSFSLSPFTQYDWSNVSRDNSMYVLRSHDPATGMSSLSSGSMSRGGLNSFAEVKTGDLFFVGWTAL
ncbi:MAG: serine/threonine protein kinase, partial [Ktedonobacteraceae bacterium]|nr:serine/threonine protein kinase [Ktedonobacteraceae bacterium]